MEKKEFDDMNELASFLHKVDDSEKNSSPVDDKGESINKPRLEEDINLILNSSDSYNGSYDGDTEDNTNGPDAESDFALDNSSAIPDENENTDDTAIDDEPSVEEEQTRKMKKKIRKKKVDAQRHRRTFAHIFGGVLLTIFIISISVLLSNYIIRAALDFSGIAMNEFDVDVEIPENATTKEISQILVDNGVIDMPDLFEFYSKLTDSDGKYIDGIFTITSTMSYETIISTLQSKLVTQQTVSVTIVEGMTADEVGVLLEENDVCKASDFMLYYKSKQDVYNFEKRLVNNTMKYFQLEGYLFPDTYEFYKMQAMTEDDADLTKIDSSANAEIAAKKIYSNFNEKISKDMYKKMSEIGLTLDETITLASIVQKEAGTLEDMKLIASVFMNRLKNPDLFPHLESDATVLYCENNIISHLTTGNRGLYETIITAYNTYEGLGLPPGPICNPGIDAINAVLNYADTDYFYFCANQDTLVTYYAATAAEHEANIAKIEAEQNG